VKDDRNGNARYPRQTPAIPPGIPPKWRDSVETRPAAGYPAKNPAKMAGSVHRLGHAYEYSVGVLAILAFSIIASFE
jgi:hypothetical protein